MPMGWSGSLLTSVHNSMVTIETQARAKLVTGRAAGIVDTEGGLRPAHPGSCGSGTGYDAAQPSFNYRSNHMVPPEVTISLQLGPG